LPVETMVYLQRVTGAAPVPLVVATMPPETLFLVRRETPAPSGAVPTASEAPGMFVLRREVP